MGCDIDCAFVNILNGIPHFLIGESCVKTENNDIRVSINKVDARFFEIAYQPFVTEQENLFACMVSVEIIGGNMGRNDNSVFVNGEAHFFEFSSANLNIVR